MTDAPERIFEGKREYVRIDIARRERKAAVAAALELAADVVLLDREGVVAERGEDYWLVRDMDQTATAIRRMTSKEGRTALEDFIKRAYEQGAMEQKQVMETEIERMKEAMDDLLMSPIGVVPKSCDEWYNGTVGTFALVELKGESDE